MFKQFLLKMSTSKHAKQMMFRNASGIPTSDFKKKNDGEVEESVPQVPVAGNNTQPPQITSKHEVLLSGIPDM